MIVPARDPNPRSPDSSASGNTPLPGLCLMALGVVYGDIGTSPLYAVRESIFGATDIAVTPGAVLGILSLIFWSLILVISVKYLLLILRADNNGEGGVLALLALLDPWQHRGGRRSAALVILGTFGAALLFGDGMLTPAISVLSAVEGLEVAAPSMQSYVLPATAFILLLLFLFQRQGTARVGSTFGPITIVWFLVLAGLGISSIIDHPRILAAIDPRFAVSFLAADPGRGFLVLGSVFLVVTGGETLFADMGHFGARPIRIAWFALVLPSLLLNYFGQGAYILANPASAHHPFYNIVPAVGVYPMIALSTVMTVIASQAVISGTYSLVRQAVQLGQAPPLSIIQTSAEEIGQIYVPFINWVLLIGVLLLVFGFGSSSALASAYGIAVSATMAITTILTFFVMRDRWKWPRPAVWLVTVSLLIIDLSFLGANLLKVASGGWFPLLVAGVALFMMLTWRRGRDLLHDRVRQRTLAIDMFLESLALDPPERIPGTAVFLTGIGDNVPSGLLHHLKLNTVLHEQVILITAITEDVPQVPASQRFDVTPLPYGFYRVIVYYGFMQSPNIPVAVNMCREFNLVPKPPVETLAYYADRTSIQPSDATGGMWTWRKRLFGYMVRNSQRAAQFYKLPPNNSVEIGIQVEL